MAKETGSSHVSAIPQFERISEAEMQTLRAAVRADSTVAAEEATDARVHRHLEHLPETLAAMGIKFAPPKTAKDRLIQAAVVAGTVALSVTATLVALKIRDRNKMIAFEAGPEVGNGNRVRPVGNRAAQLAS